MRTREDAGVPGALGRVWAAWRLALGGLPYASAAQNLELPMRLAGLPAARRRERTRALLAVTGLQALGGRPVRALSGGEQQRLAVAAAVVNEPPLLLADEPTSQLDRANVTRVLELLRDRGTRPAPRSSW